MWQQRWIRTLDVLGLGVFTPLVRLCAGEEPREQLRQLSLDIGSPIVAFAAFVGLWSVVARNVETKYGTLPTPAEVWQAGGQLVTAHFEARAKRAEFFAQQRELAIRYHAQADQLQAQAAASGPAAETLHGQAELLRTRAERAQQQRYAGSPTYCDQILTSLKTVFTGFVFATLIAVPLGVLCGVSRPFQAAISPLVQIFNPVSPLAWLPIVMIIVGAVYTTDPQEAWFEKSFISSAVTVALCSLWPTLVNTALGVASIPNDYLNVARVLKLSPTTRLVKIIIPASLPLVFTGLRISLGVGWMVLIAAEMLAQNPGLGKFVWDMFQNGSSQTLAQIMVAVFTIGFLGFLLDRLMVVLQKSVSYGAPV